MDYPNKTQISPSYGTLAQRVIVLGGYQGSKHTKYELLQFLHLLPVKKVPQDMLKGFHLLRLGFCCWNNTPTVVHEKVHKSREPEKQSKSGKSRKTTETPIIYQESCSITCSML